CDLNDGLGAQENPAKSETPVDRVLELMNLVREFAVVGSNFGFRDFQLNHAGQRLKVRKQLRQLVSACTTQADQILACEVHALGIAPVMNALGHGSDPAMSRRGPPHKSCLVGQLRMAVAVTNPAVDTGAWR